MHEQDAKKEFGRRLRAAREECELTQAEAAAKLDITKAALSAWEVGRNLPDALMLGKAARIYATTADALLYGGMPPNRQLVEALRAAIRADLPDDEPLTSRRDDRPSTELRLTRRQKQLRADIARSGSKRATKKA